MKSVSLDKIVLNGRKVEYNLVVSRNARKLRVRVRPAGVEVVLPRFRKKADARSFLRSNARWVLEQIDRAERLRAVGRPQFQGPTILYRGTETRVTIEKHAQLNTGNRVTYVDEAIRIYRGKGSRVPLAKSLEKWLRRQAKHTIREHLQQITHRLRRSPRKVFVMDQRTKWGNCSSMQNLSFSWRLIMMPEFVLRYLVTHEAVHLAVPAHSHKFWLTVQSLCIETEKARQWLSANAHRLMVDLRQVVPNPGAVPAQIGHRGRGSPGSG